MVADLRRLLAPAETTAATFVLALCLFQLNFRWLLSLLFTIEKTSNQAERHAGAPFSKHA
ncbi:hypothetical protein B9K09_09730 [Pseudomonas sp. M30-35]|nr:hypothetical protein B9K09_09730 [Pseudomonas sp. M30-35]